MGRMPDSLRTLFLHPPSFEGFDGGAGARYQARREVRSFWYPTWLAQPAAMVPGSRLIDAPPIDFTVQEVAQGRALSDVAGLTYRKNGTVGHTAPRPTLEDMDQLPFVVDVYYRDLEID